MRGYLFAQAMPLRELIVLLATHPGSRLMRDVRAEHTALASA